MTDDEEWDEPIRTPEGPRPKADVLLTITLTAEQVQMATEAAARQGLLLTEFAKDRLMEASQQRSFTFRVVPQ